MDIILAKCKYCKETFELNASQTKEAFRIIKSKNKYGSIFECANCGALTPWDPPDAIKLKPSKAIRCPKLFCPGYVNFLANPKKKPSGKEMGHWGCTECLGKWRTQETLDGEITRMIQKYPHRKKIYKKGKDGHWAPVYPEPWKLHEWYEEKLEKVEMKDYDKNIEARKTVNPKDVFRCTCLACIGHLIPYPKTAFEKRFKKKTSKEQWVCDKCDAIVDTRETIVLAIEKLVEKYPHRKLAYKKTKEGWQPASMSKKKVLEYEQKLWDVESLDCIPDFKNSNVSPTKKQVVKKTSKKVTKKSVKSLKK